MSAKHCGHHGSRKKKFFRRLFVGLISFILLVLFVVFLVWLILRPAKPRFTLQDATVYEFNISQGSNLLSSNLQVTVSSRNPNDRIGVYYDRLDLFASYRGQQITLASSIPPTYQGHNDIIIWSPYVYGTSVPIASLLASALGQDQQTGTILVNIKLDGRVRWKVGTWTSGKYHLHVSCPAYLQFGNKYPGIGNSVKFTLEQGCSVDV